MSAFRVFEQNTELNAHPSDACVLVRKNIALEGTDYATPVGDLGKDGCLRET